MKKVFLVFFLVSTLALVSAASAAKFTGGNYYNLRGNETVNENLYSAGSNLTLAGNASKDVFFAGGTILSSGKVGADLFLAGGNVTVSGEIGDDLRAAGGTVSLDARVRGETMTAGGQLSFMSGSILEGDVYAVGGQVIVDGVAKKNVKVSGDRVELHGEIDGNVHVEATELVVGDNAVVKGTLSYKSPNETVIPTSAKIGNVQYEKIEQRQSQSSEATAIFGFFWLYKLITVFVVSLIFYLLFRRGTTVIVQGALDRFWIKLLVGLAVMILLPIAGIIVAVTLVGIPFSVLAALIYFIALILSSILSGVVFGAWVYSFFNKNSEEKYSVNWLVVILGVLALSLISLIPFIGWFIAFVFFLPVFGQLFWLLGENMKKWR